MNAHKVYTVPIFKNPNVYTLPLLFPLWWGVCVVSRLESAILCMDDIMAVMKRGIQDEDDDVRAVAAEALLPLVKTIVSQVYSHPPYPLSHTPYPISNTPDPISHTSYPIPQIQYPI
jgi:hypothetical protein